MLPPHELKNKTFTRAMRGYNPVEVDEYVEFLIDKYTELYRENDELDRKLKSTVTKLEEIRGEEDSIRSALVEAKQAASQIKADAERQAETIIRSAKTSCNNILANFNTKIEEGQAVLTALKSDAAQLKQELFERYSAHIESVKALTDGIDLSDIPDADTLRREAVGSIKASLAAGYTEPPQEEAPAEAPAVDGSDDLPVDEDESDPADEQLDFAPSADPETDSSVDEEAPTQIFSTADTANELEVERTKLSQPARTGLKESVRELNKRYKADEVINTPDSDLDEDANYLDFVMSVTGKDQKHDPKKDAEFDMLFSKDKAAGKKKK